MNQFHMDLPSAVSRVLSALNACGYSAHVVGGCVRDAMRGVTPHDYDITTSATPEEMKEALVDFRLIPTGIQHGTLTVLSDGTPIEVTTYRIDGDYGDGRHPKEVTFTRDLKEDAARRDFTVNAMAWSSQTGLCDFFSGRADLENGIIRTVGIPQQRFSEDALRILRALRFASVLGFEIEKKTQGAILEMKDSLKKISAERIREEFFKLLCGQNAITILRKFHTVFSVFLPSIAPLYGFEQKSPYHKYDVWEHTLHALSHAPKRIDIRLALLFHDAGKPSCFTLDERGGHFYGHGDVSVSLAEEALCALKVDNALKHKVLTLIKYHDRVPTEDEKAIRRLLARLGEEMFFDLLTVWRADTLAQSEAVLDRIPLLDRIEKKAEKILEESPCLEMRSLAISGNEMIALGYEKSPLLGKCRNHLLSLVIDGTLPNEADALKAEAIHYLKTEKKHAGN